MSFYITFFRQQVNITFQHVLAFVIEKIIAFVGDVCFKPLIIIQHHDLHVGNIKRAMGEITSYHKRD